MNAVDALVIAIVTGTLLFGARSVAARVLLPSDTQSVFATAGLYAGERLCTVTHLAMALLGDSEIVRILRSSNASLDDIYRELQHLHDANDHAVEPAMLLCAASVHTLRPRPRDLLAQLLDSDHDVRAIFEKHRIASSRGVALEEARARALTPSGPYRASKHVRGSRSESRGLHRLLDGVREHALGGLIRVQP